MFIESLLEEMQPFPAPNSVIVMDNCPIHRSEDIRRMVAERYVHLGSTELYFMTFAGV